MFRRREVITKTESDINQSTPEACFQKVKTEKVEPISGGGHTFWEIELGIVLRHQFILWGKTTQ